MRFVVTGATSMIGVSFVNAAIEQGHQVLAIVRRNSKNICRLKQSDLVKIEYSDLESLETVKGDGKHFDALYHFAWDYTDREGRNNVEGQEKNIEYTLKAVALAHKLQIKKFVGVGSQSEYGSVDGIIDEKTPYNPQMPYSMAKVAAYWMSKEKCRQLGIKHFWGRVFSVYGNYDHEGTLLIYAIDSFLKGEKAFFSSGEQMWNYLHEKDAGRMFLSMATQMLDEDVYFIANTESMPLRRYLEKLISIYGKNAEFEFESSGTKKLIGIHPDVECVKKIPGFVPKVSFEDGIREMIEYRKSIIIK